MTQNLLSAAVVLGSLRVNAQEVITPWCYVIRFVTSCQKYDTGAGLNERDIINFKLIEIKKNPSEGSLSISY